ncbi:MAG TPA: NADPH-dependent F420 reductase [Candidatus Acidoferrales bacterium]|nr:NADPH-dependent F420 reductase [Candidatus Acidoferrales bacterium]
MARYSIAVLGAGNVGAGLARVWLAAGHAVTFGLPNPRSEKARAAVTALGGKAGAALNKDVVASAQVVALCVPWPQAEAAIQSSGSLAGKIVIDCTNPLSGDLKGLTLGVTTSAGEQVAAWALGAQVVKAFNTIGAANFGNAQFGAQRADGFYCGDDPASKSTVRELIEAAGFDPVDVGPLRNARLLEPLAMLWIDLAVNQRQGINHAFKLLRR